MKNEAEYPKACVLDVRIDAVNIEAAIDRIAMELASTRKEYICLAGVHGVMEAHRNPHLLEPHWWRQMACPRCGSAIIRDRHMERVAGPDLMLEVMKREEFYGRTHFLCGGREGIADELRQTLEVRYPWVKIVGTYCPPFGATSPVEEQAFIELVNGLRPDIVWVGISTPKQERFMARYLPLLDTRLMFSVGAAFDYHTGRISD